MEILTFLVRELPQVDTEGNKSKGSAVGTLKAAVIVVNVDCHAVLRGAHRLLQVFVLFLANFAIKMIKSNELIHCAHFSLFFFFSACMYFYN